MAARLAMTQRLEDCKTGRPHTQPIRVMAIAASNKRRAPHTHPRGDVLMGCEKARAFLLADKTLHRGLHFFKSPDLDLAHPLARNIKFR